MQSEPGLAQKTKLGTGDKAIEVTLWDRWEYEADNRAVTLLQVVEYLEQIYNLGVRDIFNGQLPLFMSALHHGGNRKTALIEKPLLDLLPLSP